MSIVPAEDSLKISLPPQSNYYREYCKLYIANIMVKRKELREEIAQLKLNFDREYSHEGRRTQSEMERRKRNRRTAGEIVRHYICPVQKCGKSYGSQGSLNQHLKIKHPSERSCHD